HQSIKASEHWQNMKKMIHEIIELFPYKEANDDTFDDQFDSLLTFLWPPSISPSKKPQHLFLVNDKIWVVAFTRKEVREIIKNEYGLVNIKIVGIPSGEVMENGMSDKDLIQLAEGSSMVIGRTD
nr:hypothetical protein [Desulfovibrio sp.]